MPLRTGATAQLDAPEVVAVEALIAAAPVPIHGDDHIGTGSDPIPEALSGAAAGLMPGGDKKNLDHVFFATLNSTSDFTNLEDAIGALEASPAEIGVFIIEGSLSFGADKTLTKALYLVASGGISATIAFGAILTMSGGAGGRAFLRSSGVQFTGGSGLIDITAIQSVVILEALPFLLQNTGDTIFRFPTDNSQVRFSVFNTKIQANIASKKLLDITATGVAMDLLLVGCKTSGGISVDLASVGAGSTVNVVINGSDVPLLTVSGAGTLNFRRDGASTLPEANLTASATNINRVGGDQIRETNGPTLLDLGSVLDGQHLKRSGTDLVGETLGSFRLLDSLAHSATTGQGENDHHAKVHDLAGAEHTPDTLANLNVKVSDATLLALAGQLGGSAASPDVRGIRETSGPTLLTIGAIADGQFARRVGSTLVGGSVAAAPGIFSAESDGDSSTTGTGFTQKVRLTFTAEAADYLIFYSAELRSSDSGTQVIAHLDQDDAGAPFLADVDPIPDSGNTVGYGSFAGCKRVTLTAASHDFDIDFATSQAGKTVNIRRARIVAMKIQ